MPFAAFANQLDLFAAELAPTDSLALFARCAPTHAAFELTTDTNNLIPRRIGNFCGWLAARAGMRRRTCQASAGGADVRLVAFERAALDDMDPGLARLHCFQRTLLLGRVRYLKRDGSWGIKFAVPFRCWPNHTGVTPRDAIQRVVDVVSAVGCEIYDGLAVAGALLLVGLTAKIYELETAFEFAFGHNAIIVVCWGSKLTRD